MDVQMLTNFLEQFALEVPALIIEDFKGIHKQKEIKILQNSLKFLMCGSGGAHSQPI